MRKSLLILAIVTLTAPAFAANHCTDKSQATCSAAAGCSWREAETWVREGDGKSRTRPAVCRFDSKLARAALASR